jgi:hypothetical protein
MSGIERNSKLVAYGVLSPGDARQSKLAAYGVFTPVDIRQSKLVAYAVLSPVPNPYTVPGTGPIPIFPALPVGYPVRLSIVMDTVVGTTKSLREMRVAQQMYPLWDIEIPFYELRDQTQNEAPYLPFAGYQEYMQLVQLWLMMYGQTGVFGFNCPWDNSRSEQLIGAGDGTTTVFNVYRTWGVGATATTAPVGLINSVMQVNVNGTIISPSAYVVGRDTITFSSPPGAGFNITMTFSYYYLCRFVEDEQDFEEFSKNRWTVPSLKFRAVLWI